MSTDVPDLSDTQSDSKPSIGPFVKVGFETMSAFEASMAKLATFEVYTPRRSKTHATAEVREHLENEKHI